MIQHSYTQLRKNATRELLQADVASQSIIVQVSQIHESKSGKLTCLVSDGVWTVKAFVNKTGVIFPEKSEMAIVMIKNHVVSDSGAKIGIIDLELVCQYSTLMGTPQPFNPESANSNQTAIKQFLIDINCVKNPCSNFYGKIKEEDMNNPQARSMKQIHPNTQKKEVLVKKQETSAGRHIPLPPVLPSSINKDFETINGLYVGLKSWHLLCRIIKKDFVETKKKNEDKMVQILTLELIDRSNMKITGTFYYEDAIKFNGELKLNAVYKISQGSIQNQNYNNSKNDKMSPFRLVFNSNSKFEEVSDVKIIANQEDSALSLDQIVDKRILDQQFDIIAILVAIDEPKEFMKGEKKLLRTNWTFADPIRKFSINAVVWNDKIKQNADLIGKTCLLSSFTLHDYNGSLTLNSKMRSNISLISVRHDYQKVEEEALNDYKSYDDLSERKGGNDEGKVFCYSMKDLEQKIVEMGNGDTIRSDLDVWVSRMFMKKWFFEACPHCDKSGELKTHCHNCNKFIEETVPHFLMSIEICDFYGSLWTTAYDQLGRKIFQAGQNQNIIKTLREYGVDQLKELSEDFQYQQFRLRIYTKRDDQGRIKHNVGKLSGLNITKMAQENVQRIKELMGQ